MAQFSFAYNIADIVSFNVPSEYCSPCTLRGTINSILINKDEAIYMIQSRYAQHPVRECDIVQPIFSTKSFDVFYPGVEVYVKTKDGFEVPAFVESAVISNGRLRYWLNSSDNLDCFQADEGNVRLANTRNNIDKFQ
ncbi:hypothetical protein pEaSNUABM40_00147 [Erwinia phage pEa_SNUABM_40]|uniref:Uncharacterized protein n=1 Tax=Erwinia phage pEa_SNUABM_3 TaxID=2869552 RepID=A0AAE7XIV4_9CAUD|nr:hypothetical protein MPK68_gp146 [Erwinia phage pEa_SNUABM_3]QZE56682.1 hypothetical protein pEaSNUABM20_00146 [Erwinia phage pEa_SNUABM_20]QZE58363.1 hypothetical protein pEaSNUABM40_00147 [Erwinia phage pEa_SNUABM_40]UAW52927.1 hypothetical protein pEaSNUABM23_00145 [Erwinia phage pEa_SNUABM_23]UIW10823.1 hypothetical protein pEaSNUABM23_00145 [Erwinia phage pEa_SNUABM_31]QZE56343.1 hypothetical protein pEaSNUABM3_00146 [Erwinia phage pEa_SNUABM_3]